MATIIQTWPVCVVTFEDTTKVLKDCNALKLANTLWDKQGEKYTVAELGEMLPDWVNFTQKNYNSISGRTWFRCGSEKVMMWCDGDTEADARAKMAIPLIKEGIIGEC